MNQLKLKESSYIYLYRGVKTVYKNRTRRTRLIKHGMRKDLEDVAFVHENFRRVTSGTRCGSNEFRTKHNRDHFYFLRFELSPDSRLSVNYQLINLRARFKIP